MHVVKSEIGPINEGDLYDAWTNEADIITMDNPLAKRFENKRREYEVKILNYTIIYKFMEDIKRINEESNPKKEEIEELGYGRVLKLFEIRLNEKSKKIRKFFFCKMKPVCVLFCLLFGRFYHRVWLQSRGRQF